MLPKCKRSSVASESDVGMAYMATSYLPSCPQTRNLCLLRPTSTLSGNVAAGRVVSSRSKRGRGYETPPKPGPALFFCTWDVVHVGAIRLAGTDGTRRLLQSPSPRSPRKGNGIFEGRQGCRPPFNLWNGCRSYLW